MLFLDLTTGLRRGELVALKWSDLNIQKSELKIRRQYTRIKGELVISKPKTPSAIRTIKLTKITMKVLKRYKQGACGEWMFPSPKQDLSSLQRAVSDHCEEAFIEYTYPFDDDCMILGNEEAKLCGMEGNRRLFGSVYAGPIFITRDNGEGDLCALTDEQVKTYGEMFAVPEDISPAEVQRDVGFTFYGWG